MRKRILATIMTAAMALTLFGCGNTAKTSTNNTDTADKSQQVVEESDPNLLSGKYYVMIEVEDYGNITCELDADAAPITVTNFMKLVDSGFYNGLTFHRIIDGFMMQGGDPTGTGTGGSDETITGEFYDNNIPNDISHTRGTISMARSAAPDSASSQFFIVHEDSTFLDRQYAGFGHVVAGIEVVDAICENAIVEDSNGTVAPENQPVIKGIYNVTAEYLYDQNQIDNPIPSNALEEACGKTEFDSYDEIVSYLTTGMGYAYVKVTGLDEKILLITTLGTYDNLDGNMATIEVYPYLPNSNGKFECGSVISSGGTAYPISIKDGVLYAASNHEVDAYVINDDASTPGIMYLSSVYVTYDTDGNETYGGFIRSSNSFDDEVEVAPDDAQTLADAFTTFESAEVINFETIK